MKMHLLFIFASIASYSAQDVLVVNYGKWTELKSCGGKTRLKCDEVRWAKENNRCYIEFQDTRCTVALAHVNAKFEPDSTSSVEMIIRPPQSKHILHTYDTVLKKSKLDKTDLGAGYLNLRLYNAEGILEKVQYQFVY